MIPTLETFIDSGFRPGDSIEEQLVKQVDEKAAALRALLYSVLTRNTQQNPNFREDVANAHRVLSQISRLREELGNLPNASVGGKRKRRTLKKRKTKRRRT